MTKEESLKFLQETNVWLKSLSLEEFAERWCVLDMNAILLDMRVPKEAPDVTFP